MVQKKEEVKKEEAPIEDDKGSEQKKSTAPSSIRTEAVRPTIET